MNITMAFVCVQPIFDLLSFLYIRGYIPIGISTFGKPLIIGVINIILILTYKKNIVKHIISYGAYGILMVAHLLLLYGMDVDMSVILHEARFMLNILYMLICFFTFKILYNEAPDKDLFIRCLKKTLLFTFFGFIFIYFIALATGTSEKTYEYADALKRGYKGWLDSGQIFGHAMSMCLPFLMCYLLNNKAENKTVRTILKLSIVLPITVLCLLGTKVSYYMAVLVLFSQLVLELYFAIKDKENTHYINSAICIVLFAVCLLVYPITPVKHNIDINNSVTSIQYEEDEISNIVEKEKNNLVSDKKNENDKNDNDSVGDDKISEAEKNDMWTTQAFEKLEQKYISGEIHPADMRNKQLFYNLEKFKLSDFKYKIFGIGYLNQKEMAIERDVLCVLFSFGIWGFALILARPVLLWIKSAFLVLKNLFKCDIYTLCLFESFSVFFFISWFAGYTFIYTNFSIYLGIIMVLLIDSCQKLSIKRS
ncbi:MAG: O-antigen ligase family protein [Clostridia bacterium]|nr:O-antigen ligase family protein [Clostridia bacterium]